GPVRYRADPAGRACRHAGCRDPCKRPRVAAGSQLVPFARTAYAARAMQATDRAVEGTTGTLTLAAARVANGEGGLSGSPAWVSVSDGRVIATGVGPAPTGAVDLGDALLAPGFLDIQINGTGPVDFATATVDEIVTALDEQVAHGTTGVLLTLCSSPLDAY